MKCDLRVLVAASLLGSTAIVPAALAQEATGDQTCDRLATIVDEQRETFQDIWIEEATGVVEQGDDPQCQPYIQQAEDALQRLEAGEEVERVEGRIVLSQPAPAVSVEQPAPQVEVAVPDPRVTVQQAQPEIIVRQAPPTVTIDMPRPTVTIDQPQPEIIVRMPDPQVDVAQGEPQIDVTQAQPDVSVQQPEPELDIVVGDTGQAEADVQVEQGEPQVALTGGEGQAAVEVEEAQPQVTYEPAEPIVEFQEGGEPEVQFTESGEPNVQVEDAGGAQAADQQAADQQAAPQADEGPDVWLAGRTVVAAPVVQVEGYQEAPADQITADTLMGADVYSANEENIGSINDVVMSDDGQVEYVVLDVGGFLGFGSHQVALGFEELTVLQNEAGDDFRAYVNMTQEDLEQMPEYQAPS